MPIHSCVFVPYMPLVRSGFYLHLPLFPRRCRLCIGFLPVLTVHFCIPVSLLPIHSLCSHVPAPLLSLLHPLLSSSLPWRLFHYCSFSSFYSSFYFPSSFTCFLALESSPSTHHDHKSTIIHPLNASDSNNLSKMLNNI